MGAETETISVSCSKAVIQALPLVRNSWRRLVPFGVPIVPIPIPVPVIPVAPGLRPPFTAVIRSPLAPSVVVGIDAADGNTERTHRKCQAEKTIFHVGPRV